MPLTYTRKKGLAITDVSINSTLSCNLECVGCNSFSDLKVDDGFSINDRLCWLDDLSVFCKRNRVLIESFTILGGEPLVDEGVLILAQRIKQHWPLAIIEVYTNGLLLSNRLNDWAQRFVDLNITIEVTVHDLPEKLKAKIISGAMQWRDRGVKVRIAGNGPSYDINLNDFWQQTFIYSGDKVYPHDHDQPKIAWLNCALRDCHTLQDGELHHCPITALLPSLLKHTGQTDDPLWNKYLAYKPLIVNEADEIAIADFFSRTPGDVCAMCPMSVGRVKGIPAIPQDRNKFDRETWLPK